MNTHNVEKIIDYFAHVKKWLKIPSSENENQRLIKFATALRNHSHTNTVRDLLDLIYKNIDDYERHAYPTGHKSPSDILEFLDETDSENPYHLEQRGSQEG